MVGGRDLLEDAQAQVGQTQALGLEGGLGAVEGQRQAGDVVVAGIGEGVAVLSHGVGPLPLAQFGLPWVAASLSAMLCIDAAMTKNGGLQAGFCRMLYYNMRAKSKGYSRFRHHRVV